jgi:putative DNA methylase
LIPKECKRLAEVDFPIADVSRHSAQDKYLRYKPTTTLHPWWAQRPLAACRAVLLALLLPDPCDANCPESFKEEARNLLQSVQGGARSGDDELRHGLLKFIGDFAAPILSQNSHYLRVSRALIRAAYGEETPLIADTFAGAGSIPLEGARLGCDIFASDLNPVATLILKAVLEDIPREGAGFADDVRHSGEQVKICAERELNKFYPVDLDGARPIAYIWARTVRCEAPRCGAEIPMVSSFWLCKKASHRQALRFDIVREPGRAPELQFDVFVPKSDSEVPNPNITRAKATCLCCSTVLSPDRVRSQLREQRGGADPIFNAVGKRVGGARLLAVVTRRLGDELRRYRPEADHDYVAVSQALAQLEHLSATNPPNGLSLVPDEPLPLMSGTFNVPIYGINRWGDLFSSRQALAIVTISKTIARIFAEDGRQTVAELLAFALSKFARHCNGNARWNNVVESAEPAFGTQALPITWTFPESVPWGPWAENYNASVSAVATTLERGFTGIEQAGQVQLADARDCPLPDDSCSAWFIDPPYYFAVPYADLSDFFFVWLKRTLPGHPLLRDPFDKTNPLTPKDRELCEMAHWDKQRYAKKDKAFFEAGMREAFEEGRRILVEDGIACVVFAHKTTEAWEALLSGMIDAGWVVTASWPIATERAGRIRARESAALAVSIHLICRPRAEIAAVGDWADVLRELPKRVGDWMERLQGEGVRGADLVFACIGPALEIFSRYARVETAEGRQVALAEYFEKVWEVVGRSALAQVLGTADASARNGAAGAVEEDARLTALFLWTLQSTTGDDTDDTSEGDAEEPTEDQEDEDSPRNKSKGFTLVFDVVRRFAQPLGIDLPKWEGRVIETKKGIVRLLPIAERAKELFGEDGAQAVAARIEREGTLGSNTLQGLLFPEAEPVAKPWIHGRHAARSARLVVSDEPLSGAREATTLDRVHAAMLLQAGGRANALRALLKAEQERGSDFLRLANALSALYPKGSEEKRLLDAMLLAVPR